CHHQALLPLSPRRIQLVVPLARAACGWGRPRCSLASIGASYPILSFFAEASLPGAYSMTDEILTLPEVAKLLKVAEKTVYTMAQKHDRPGFKVGGQWRFKRADI